MEFLLVFDWVDENTFELYQTYVKFYETKEELLKAKKHYEQEYNWQINTGRLILSPAIRYSWTDIEQLF